MTVLLRLTSLLILVVLVSCQREQTVYRIAGDIEEPKDAIIQTISELVNRQLEDSLVVSKSPGLMANLDSLELGVYDFMVTDNYVPYREDIYSVVPLYPQILHILMLKDDEAADFKSLVTGKKIYAGNEGTSTRMFVSGLMRDFNVPEQDVHYLNVMQLFEADVIFTFTDIVSAMELMDLQDYKLYSLDDPLAPAGGSIADAICLRYPQFQPYVIPHGTYDAFTPAPIVTISNEALLVARKGLDEDFVYRLAKLIHERKQAFDGISPLLYHGISENYNIQQLSFTIHPGARRYLERHAPTFIERYAELMGVIITILIAISSGAYTLIKLRKGRKKEKIDVYYRQLVDIREHIVACKSKEQSQKVLTQIHQVQNEAMELIMKEKLLADESFLIFMKFAQVVVDEAREVERHLTHQLHYPPMIKTNGASE